MSDLEEVTKRVKVQELEGKGVRIPKITRSVGLQVQYSRNSMMGSGGRSMQERKVLEYTVSDAIFTQVNSRPAPAPGPVTPGPLSFVSKPLPPSVSLHPAAPRVSPVSTPPPEEILLDDEEVLEVVEDAAILPLTLALSKAGTGGIVVQWNRSTSKFDFSQVRFRNGS